MNKGEYMFKVKIVLIIMMVIGGVSCSHDSHQNNKISIELTLNNGEKWHSDKHTMDSINSMKEIVFYSKTTGENPLKKSLDAELNKLIQGCTMEGENHDALHVYLEELMPLIEKLEDADKEVSKHAEKKIKNLLAQYSDYFELK